MSNIDPKYQEAYWTLFSSLMLKFFPDGDSIANEIKDDEESQTGFKVGREVGQLTSNMIMAGIVEFEKLTDQVTDREAKRKAKSFPPQP